MATPSRPIPQPRLQLEEEQKPEPPRSKEARHRPLELSRPPSMCKVVITIPSLVRLRRTLRRWRSRAAEAASSSSSSSSAAVPAGHVAVSVQGTAPSSGPRRFVVRVAHLSHPAFLELLRQAEEEYGFPAAPGPIALPCDEDHFLDVLHRVSSSASSSTCCCGPVVARRGRGDARPLLQGMAVEKLVW
ncbi:auxin-responsive protein SAUR36-like [Miscanthus floridulus]|uniref:auxin-responsive protein SAUR36-like n=1 Tax=Miscanthus floridulus TaxID=154761 RepID=UPI00345993C1